ncbi:hypothetical protein [Vannielia litorea]|nr:hypothetical protein [Vannielia litorea]
MILRSLISGLMLVTLLVAGQALAVARGQAPVAMQAVLCTGFGTQVIHLDAEGKPVSAPHLCPDGLAAMVEAHVPLPELVQREGAERAVAAGVAARPEAWLARAVFEARGPPLA